MATLEVESGKQIYYEHYKGDGPPVVLVHGWGVTGRIWDLTLPALLDAGHEIVLYDHRCCGRSDKDFADVTTKANGADVVKLVKATGLDSPVVVGWSYGAAVVAEAAAALGGSLAGIVLIAPPTPRYTQADGFPHGGTAEIMEQTLTALRDTRPDFLRAMTEGVCHTPQSASMIDWIWQMFMETSPNADGGLRDLGVIDHREVLPTIEIPALICKGSHDAVVDPAIADVCADLLPNARLIEYADSGHGLLFEERERFNRDLVGFVANPAGSVTTERGNSLAPSA